MPFILENLNNHTRNLTVILGKVCEITNSPKICNKHFLSRKWSAPKFINLILDGQLNTETCCRARCRKHKYVSTKFRFVCCIGYPVSSWFHLRQTREIPLCATVCFSIKLQTARDSFDVNFICQLQSKLVKHFSHKWINKFVIANLISVIISIICSLDE